MAMRYNNSTPQLQYLILHALHHQITKQEASQSVANWTSLRLLFFKNDNAVLVSDILIDRMLNTLTCFEVLVNLRMYTVDQQSQYD